MSSNLSESQQKTLAKLVKQGSMGASHMQRATLDALVIAGLVKVRNQRAYPAEADVTPEPEAEPVESFTVEGLCGFKARTVPVEPATMPEAKPQTPAKARRAKKAPPVQAPHDPALTGGHLTCGFYECCEDKRDGHDCKGETRAMRAALRTGKPAHYTWRMWNHPDAGKPKPFHMPSKPSTQIEGSWKAAVHCRETSGEMQTRQELFRHWLTSRYTDEEQSALREAGVIL